MKLQDATWQDVEQLSRDVVVLIPTGSLEQHGPALPLFTDSILVTAVAEKVEQALANKILLTPTLWLGASGHHLAFDGTLSASFSAYYGAIASVIESLIPRGFHRFFLLNGHGGNSEPNGVVLRELKARYSNLTFAHSSYYEYAKTTVAEVLEGPLKVLRHACEAETSLMMYVRPDLVRTSKLRDDGLVAEPPISSIIHHFDALTEEGSFGFATLAAEEKGQKIFAAAVDGAKKDIEAIANGYFLRGL